MASLSQISGSILSAQNQNTLALVNFNIDFSLIKIAAPEEYQRLGTALSSRRRESAEEGPLHRTARKLGALFEGIIPDIPQLTEAYGKRVAEIVEHSHAETKVIVEHDYGPFASHIGLDGTSIYAAATSGPKVIALHLLACMLARAWTGPEATAIWVELVASRKSELEKSSHLGELHGLFARAVAQQEITRSQLAAWDASARAWLRSADEAKRFEQTQLRLIIKDSGLQLSTSGTTYASVIEAWTMAMTSLQKLVLGIPQNISKASVLLGLLSWHIYPDLNVVDPMTNIKFCDKLVDPPGILTLGLRREGSEDTGVRWSLALSHLRYYGDPVAVERCIGSDNGRITVSELHIITLGCVMSSWFESHVVDVLSAADCFVALGECLWPENVEHGRDPSFSIPEWLGLLVKAAKIVTTSIGSIRENAIGLVEFGRRRGRKFLDESLQSSVPMFGLANPILLFNLSDELEGQGVEATLPILRDLATRTDLHTDECIIRYHPQCDSTVKAEDTFQNKKMPEYTTAVPHTRVTGKHTRDGNSVQQKRHTFWIHIDETLDPREQIYYELFKKVSQDQSISKVELDSIVLDLKQDIAVSNIARNPENPQGRIMANANPAFLGCSCDTEFNNRFLCRYNCPCAKRRVSCTSLCACIRNYTFLTQNMSCQNLRPRRAELIRAGNECHWLPPHDSSLTEPDSSNNPVLQWASPPRAFAKRDESLAGCFHNHSDTSSDFELADLDRAGNLPGRQVTPHPVNSRDNIDFNLDGFESAAHWPALEISSYAMNSEGSIEFTLLAGNKVASLFLLENAPDSTPLTTISFLTEKLRSGKINRQRLAHYLSTIPSEGMCRNSRRLLQDRNQAFVNSLSAIAAASKLYSEWTEATVSIEITRKEIGLSHWAEQLQVNKGYAHEFHESSINYRSIKFACIAMLESGVHDFHPNQLEMVLAMASGNSMYVAESLLQDPSNVDRSTVPEFLGIRRILGNLDRPGIVMLVPPQAPRIREPDLKSWRIVQPVPFDGLITNHFTNTSLHLSFTDFEIPIAIATGAYDPEVILLEALISVHDGRHWVADLDILGSFANDKLRICRGCTTGCKSLPDPQRLGQLLAAEVGERLTSIENWEALLCCNENLLRKEIGVVRAYHSWHSRLAAMAICVRKGLSTILLPTHCVCVECSTKIVVDNIWFTGSEGPFILIT